MAKEPVQAVVEARPDETTIAEVFRTVWRKRGIVLIALAIGILIGLWAAASSFPRAPAPVTHYISLTGMEITRQGNVGDPNDRLKIVVTYPNGSVFLPRDLLDPQVLQRVREQLGLGNDVPLNGGIGVSFEAPWTEGIMRRYKERLAVRGITQADIDSLNSDLERDLLSANMGGLRIDVSPAALGVSGSVAVAIAKALPQAWRDVYTDRYRTLLNTDLPNLMAEQDDGDLSNPPSVTAAQMKIVSMLRGLDMMANDNRLATVTNANGLTANDLEANLRQFRTVHFAPFAAPVFATDNPSVVAYRKDLESRLAASKREAETMNRTLQDVLSNPIGKAALQPSMESVVQSDGTMLSQLLALAQRASLTPMVPDIMNKRDQINANIGRLERELIMISSPGAPQASSENPADIAAALRKLTEDYRSLYTASVDRLRTASSTFYADLSAPAIPAQPTITPRTIALFAAPIALALLAAIAYMVLAALVSRYVVRR
ncbi:MULTISPECIES: hypothetical protein [Mesorhizobium]|uniref:Uncharacterized protein n=1 Tax=Mesorhizobium denitrificans TaxID=2294114 RepID=A0A371XD90_9HYPH|nr:MULTISPECIES: hypothetical protein [Mesorhizobium]RFC67208.1 hypothetical protein DY251_11625 [Mesorhizobium denitrificans]